MGPFQGAAEWYQNPRTTAPASAPARISQAGFTVRSSTNTPSDPTASAADTGSITAARPRCQVTTAIIASDATLTPSSTPLAIGEARRRGTSGPLSAT